MIYVECKADRELVLTLGIGKKKIIHAGGKSAVCKRLENGKRTKGLVDEDPESFQPPYIKSLKILEKKASLKLLYDSLRKNYLIVLCPRLEEWILEAAKEARIDLKNYNLPETGDKLHANINLNLKNFQRLLHSLKKNKSKRLAVLEEFLKET